MSKARFWVGQRVTVRLWEGEPVERDGRIEGVGRSTLLVLFEGFFDSVVVFRAAVIWEEEK